MTKSADTPSFVVVEAKALAKAMKIASAIIETRVVSPILLTVRLAYSPKGLSIEATDLDLVAALDVDEIEGEGSWRLCVSAKDLTSISAAAGVTPIRIEPVQSIEGKGENQKTRHHAVIKAGAARYELQALDPEDFPTIAGDRMQRIERFTNGQLGAMLKKVSVCISTEETRYYLNGVNWSSKPEGLRLTATDGHRLAAYRYAGNEGAPSFSYIIPRKTCSIVAQFLDAADIEIFSVGNGNTVIDTVLDMKSTGISLRTKLIDGTYPDFDRVIPKEENFNFDIRQEEILSAIRQATAIGGWRGQAIRLAGVEGRLSVSVKSPDADTAKVETQAEWPEGLPDFGVNSRYMSEMVRHCQGTVRFGMASAGAPITISDEDKNMTRIVMPMRV